MQTDNEIIDNAAQKAANILHVSLEGVDKIRLIYLYSLLFSKIGHDTYGKSPEEGDENMRHFLNTHNKHLGFCPGAYLTSEYHMNEIIKYLESF